MTMTNANSSSAEKKGRRPLKFTPQAIEKIKEFVKQGFSREEIAKSLGVTMGSLQVTCSRLGISLRRPSGHHPSYDELKTQSRPQLVVEKSSPTAKLVITMKRRDHERAFDVPLSQEVLGRLGIYAALQGMGLSELIAQVLSAAVKKDMVGTILDGEERPA
jgi:hypothetical protein